MFNLSCFSFDLSIEDIFHYQTEWCILPLDDVVYFSTVMEK